MKEWISKIAKYLGASFDTHSQGASARKLSAFALIMCIVALHIAFIHYCIIKDNFTQMELILTVDYAFIAALLGMTTYETVKKINSKTDKDAGAVQE